MSSQPASKNVNRFSLEERLQHGNLTIDEVMALKPCSRSAFYDDLKVGLVKIVKRGRRSFVPGPIAKDYIGASA